MLAGKRSRTIAKRSDEPVVAIVDVFAKGHLAIAYECRQIDEVDRNGRSNGDLDATACIERCPDAIAGPVSAVVQHEVRQCLWIRHAHAAVAVRAIRFVEEQL